MGNNRFANWSTTTAQHPYIFNQPKEIYYFYVELESKQRYNVD